MTRQSTVDKPKTSRPSHQPLPVCALRKLAGFADKSTSVAPTQTQTRNASGTEIGTRYRYIDDTPLVPFSETGNSANSTSAAGATAKTRSRPSNEYVLYSYGEPVAVSADGNASYFGTDILGSVRSVTDKYGNVQSNYNYDVFGNPYLSNLDNDMSFGYCGKIYDNGTGLYDYGFRDYSPNQARFTTVDPIRDGNNWFAYVVNDPVNYVDLWGLETLKEKIKRTLVADDWVLYNDTDIVIVAYPESIPKNIENGTYTKQEYADFIKSMLIYPGEKSPFRIDGSSYPDKFSVINDPSTWVYVGVTDGNSLRITKNEIGIYKISLENTTHGFSLGNIASQITQAKGPYFGFIDMSKHNKEMYGWYFSEKNKEPNWRNIVFNDANALAAEANKQLQNKKTVSPTNSNSSLGSNISFNNITFDNSGNAVLAPTTDFSTRLNNFVKNAFNLNPFNSFSGGCTK